MGVESRLEKEVDPSSDEVAGRIAFAEAAENRPRARSSSLGYGDIARCDRSVNDKRANTDEALYLAYV